MKILAPANHPDEVELLVGSGADELYCGVVPREWTEQHGPAAQLNRRGAGRANMTSLAELGELVQLAHALGATVQLTLNAPTYSEQQTAFLCRLAAQAVDELGVDGLIIADVGLLCTLVDWRDDLRLHVSSLAAVRNAEAARFFRDLGAARVILPRQTRLDEAVSIARAVPELEIEAFVLNDGCIFEEGHCSTVHAVGPICLSDWEYTFRPLEGTRELAAAEVDAMRRNLDDYRAWIDCQVGSGPQLTPTGMPAGPCGLCSIPHLHRGGVHSAKIIGREAPAHRKLRSVQQVRLIRDRAVAAVPSDECRALARAVRGTPELCASGYGCYYPEVVRGGAAAGDPPPALDRSS
jgi:U32 family peptidase